MIPMPTSGLHTTQASVCVCFVCVHVDVCVHVFVYRFVATVDHLDVALCRPLVA